MSMYIRGSVHGDRNGLNDTIHSVISLAETVEPWTEAACLSEAIAYLYDILENIDYED